MAETSAGSNRRRLRRRLLAAGVLVLLAAVSWVGVRGLLARRHLDDVRTEVAALREALLADDRSSVPDRLARVRDDAAAARRLTSDPVWSTLSRIPLAGRSLRTAAGVAGAVDELARDALPALDRASTALALPSIRPAGDRIAVERFDAVRAPLEQVRDSVTRTERRVRALPGSLLVPAVGNARTELLAQLTSLRDATAAAADAARLVPPMLGRDGPRHYLVTFLNNAEMRGSGGMLGAYGVLVADRGRLTLREIATNDDLRSAETPVADLGAEYARRYARFESLRFWQNANMSPHFPNAARLWLGLWQDNRRERLDGVVAVDPVAMAKVLAVTGPVTLKDGERITAENVVERIEGTSYIRFGDDKHARGRYFVNVADAVYRTLVSSNAATPALLDALGAAASTRHLHVASAHPEEQDVIERTAVGGALPDATGAPFLLVTTQNAGGNKLDYYIRREVRYDRDGDDVTVEVRLANLAPPNLPTYAGGREDLKPNDPERPPGEHHLYVSVFAGHALLDGATLDSRAIAMESERERGHRVYSAFVLVPRGGPVVLRLRLHDDARGRPRVVQQPVVVPDTVRIDV